MRSQKDRYFSDIELLADTPVVAEVIDHEAVRALVHSWNWDGGASPGFSELNQVLKILSLADFVRFTLSRLAGLRESR